MGDRARDDPSRRCLPLRLWPEVDRVAWERALLGGDLLEETGVAARWSTATRRRVVFCYGRFLGWLQRRGLLAATNSGLELLQPEVMKAYVADLTAVNASYTVLGHIEVLRRYIAAVRPELRLDWLHHLEGALRRAARPQQDKRARLQSIQDLVALGETIMAHARQEASTSARGLTSYRNGLMLAFLALRPLRLKNFTGLTVGGSLRRIEGVWWILMDAMETKTHQPIELLFPTQLAPALDHYLGKVRPALLQRRGRWHGPVGHNLWISDHGGPMTPAGIYRQITTRTRQAFGRSVNPHLFRAAAATSLAVASPEAVRAGALILGHARYATTQRYYNLAQGIEAARSYQRLMEIARGKVRMRTVLPT